jgi:hypothetical protein
MRQVRDLTKRAAVSPRPSIDHHPEEPQLTLRGHCSSSARGTREVRYPP